MLCSFVCVCVAPHPPPVSVWIRLLGQKRRIRFNGQTVFPIATLRAAAERLTFWTKKRNPAHRATLVLNQMVDRLTSGTKKEFTRRCCISWSGEPRFVHSCPRGVGPTSACLPLEPTSGTNKTNPRRWTNHLSNCHIACGGGVSGFQDKKNENVAHRATPALEQLAGRLTFGTKKTNSVCGVVSR